MPQIHATPKFAREFNHTADLLQVAVHRDTFTILKQKGIYKVLIFFVKTVRAKTNF